MDLKNLLFWVFLIIGLILIIWNIFGNSPTEFIALVSLIFAVLNKTWSISDRQVKSDLKMKFLVRDFNNLSSNFDGLNSAFNKHIKRK